LRFYDGATLEITPQLRAQFIFDDHSFEVEAINGVRWNRSEQRFELKVRWAGFESADDTWEPAASLYEQIPNIVKDYLCSEVSSNVVANNCWQAIVVASD
jgi:hypothetical protein